MISLFLNFMVLRHVSSCARGKSGIRRERSCASFKEHGWESSFMSLEEQPAFHKQSNIDCHWPKK
jgi:hypothetical protein